MFFSDFFAILKQMFGIEFRINSEWHPSHFSHVALISPVHIHLFIFVKLPRLTCGPYYVGELSVVVCGICTSQPPQSYVCASCGFIVDIATATCWPCGTTGGKAAELLVRPVRPLDAPPFLRNELLMPLDTRLERRLTAPPMPLKPPLSFFINPTSSSSSAGGTSMFPEYQNTHQMRLRKMTMAPA